MLLEVAHGKLRKLSPNGTGDATRGSAKCPYKNKIPNSVHCIRAVQWNCVSVFPHSWFFLI
jgi:hypothetical protein